MVDDGTQGVLGYDMHYEITTNWVDTAWLFSQTTCLRRTVRAPVPALPKRALEFTCGRIYKQRYRIVALLHGMHYSVTIGSISHFHEPADTKTVEGCAFPIEGNPCYPAQRMQHSRERVTAGMERVSRLSCAARSSMPIRVAGDSSLSSSAPPMRAKELRHGRRHCGDG
jgi:hypothetical protein